MCRPHIYTSRQACVWLFVLLFLAVFHVEVGDNRGEWGAHSHSVGLFVKLTFNAEIGRCKYMFVQSTDLLIEVLTE